MITIQRNEIFVLDKIEYIYKCEERVDISKPTNCRICIFGSIKYCTCKVSVKGFMCGPINSRYPYILEYNGKEK